MQYTKQNIIVEKTVAFALMVIEYVDILESKRKFVVANQLLKSGTSIGANVHEAQNAESKNDFIHKTKIAAKEAYETRYWLKLCQHSPGYPDCSLLQNTIEEIMNILSKIISTTKNKYSI